jgi:hypothetical protein
MKLTLQEKTQVVEYIMNEVNKFWIKYKGDLFNHKDFWDETLHSFTNEDWSIILDVMELIRLEDPSCFIPFAQDVFLEARKVIELEGHDANLKALDARKNKKKAFKALVYAKDCWNNFTGYEAPTKFKPDPEPPTVFENLFELKV